MNNFIIWGNRPSCYWEKATKWGKIWSVLLFFSSSEYFIRVRNNNKILWVIKISPSFLMNNMVTSALFTNVNWMFSQCLEQGLCHSECRELCRWRGRTYWSSRRLWFLWWLTQIVATGWQHSGEIETLCWVQGQFAYTASRKLSLNL